MDPAGIREIYLFRPYAANQYQFEAAARDLPVIMAVTVVGAAAVVLGNLVSDLLYAVVDPRVRGAE